MGFVSLLRNHTYKQLLHCWLSKWNKSSITVISQNFTGKNIHWQPARENVASASDVIIKGDKSSKGNLWKIKGCRGGVGVELEDVLVAWSVGPVPTKHLISLIKRTLAWYVANSGDSGHAPSLHSPPLSHTHPDTAISHNNTRDKREKANFWASSQDVLLCDPAKTRQETVFEARQRLTVRDVSAVTDHRLSCSPS